MARVQADLEAVRIAELYANHPLLKHMPVPRFRLPSVHLDIPVLIRGEDEGDSDQRPTLEPEDAAEKFLEVLDAVLEDHDRQLLYRRARERPTGRRAQGGGAPGVAARRGRGHHRHGDRPVEDRHPHDPDPARARSGGRHGRGRRRPRTGPRTDARGTAAQGHDHVHPVRRLAAPLEADMVTSHVKEAGDAEVLARVKMEVTEDGVEWATVVDRDGELAERLVSE